MSLESRTNSALMKRAEQLKRWEESLTNREPASPKHKSRKVNFSSGCVFLAACAAGDKEEVLKLLEMGADINTANVDGLTALHQACIDDNLDMVEFLVKQGADVNMGDNEGWTPLHATASCGFMYIAKYLIEQGADVAAVNNDGELAIDIAECQRMEELLKEEIRKKGVDCDAARNDEERAMLRDAKEWLASKSPASKVNEPHPKTGATALHVAAAKGYLDVIKILLQCGADIDAQDVDGWTPIHAAAHWGQEEACRLLVENLADLEAKNFVGQTAFDLADGDMSNLLEDLKKKQNKEEVTKRKAKKQRAEAQVETPQVKKVKVEITGLVEENTKSAVEMEVSSESESESGSSETSSDSESEEASSEEDEKKNRVNAQQQVPVTPTTGNSAVDRAIIGKEPEVAKPPVPPKSTDIGEEKMPWRQPPKPKSDLGVPDRTALTLKDFKAVPANINYDNDVTLRRTKSFQNDESFYTKYKALHARIQANNVTSTYNTPSARPKSDIILTNSTNSHYNRSHKEEKNTDDGNSAANSPTKGATTPTPTPVQTSFRSGLKLPLNETAATNGTVTPTKATTPTGTTPPGSTPPTPQATRFQMFKNFFKSFVPPARDEESETQRKAHAKRVRETRRSTQGVTLEEIKSAEQLVKLKNQPNNNNNNNDATSGGGGDNGSDPAVSVSVTISTATPTVITKTTETAAPPTVSETSTNGSSSDVNTLPEPETHERRPSWRLKVDGGSKFKLEDATKPETPSTPSFVRRLNPTVNLTRPSSAPIDTAETTVTIPLRRPKSLEEKDQDKENDARNAQATLATQAAIQRRRRPKRRSTGVVSFDNVEDMDQEKDPAAGGDTNVEIGKFSSNETSDSSRRARGDLSRGNSYRERSVTRSRSSLPGMGSRSLSLTSLNSEGYISGSERSSRSRINSTVDIRNENGEIDYKKLYEEQLVENDRLKEKLRKSDEELRETKQTLERINVVTSKNSLSELEKRERRAMERKLSEMEEELKNLDNLKSENQRLKDENGALIRVISKLSK